MDASPFGCWRSRGKMPSCCHATQPGHVPEDAGAPDCLSYLSPRVAREMVHECRVWASPLVKPETAVVSDQLKKQDPKLQTLGTETVFELHGSPPPPAPALFFLPLPPPTTTTTTPAPPRPQGRWDADSLLVNHCSVPLAFHPQPLPSPVSLPSPYLDVSCWAGWTVLVQKSWSQLLQGGGGGGGGVAERELSSPPYGVCRVFGQL